MYTNNPFANIYINRTRKKKKIVLYKKVLCTANTAEEAAKLYMKFLEENKDENIDNIHFEITKVEEEEDHYGHFGGVNEYITIYKYGEESDTEYNGRIYEAESYIWGMFEEKLAELTHNFMSAFMSGMTEEQQKENKMKILKNFSNLLENEIMNY